MKRIETIGRAVKRKGRPLRTAPSVSYRPSKKVDRSILFQVSNLRDEARPLDDRRFSAIGY
jgi:hypothetical protein